jgi:hypothetical protein
MFLGWFDEASIRSTVDELICNPPTIPAARYLDVLREESTQPAAPSLAFARSTEKRPARFASRAPNLFQGGRPKRAASHRRVLHLFADSSRSP